MKEHYDPWYIRLPDGRVVKAKSTTSIRHHVEAGNIPLNSMARRDSNEEWVALSWIAEFNDLGGGPKKLLSLPEMDLPAPPLPNHNRVDGKGKSGIADRLDPMRLQTVGIRGLVDELIAAFDSTVSSGKILLACAVASIGTLAIVLATHGLHSVYSGGAWLAQVLAGVAGLAILASITSILTRQTHEEISTMRPVSISEAAEGIGSFVFRIFLGYVATIGVGIGILVLLNHLPEWLADPLRGSGVTFKDIVLTAVWVISLAIAIVVFVLMLLSLLLPPILIVEECSVGDALREWRSILREHKVRVLIYEGLVLALAFVASLPVALPVNLAMTHGPQFISYNWIATAYPPMLYALAAGPGIAFLAVANLFVYLNLRYEYSPRK